MWSYQIRVSIGCYSINYMLTVKGVYQILDKLCVYIPTLIGKGVLYGNSISRVVLINIVPYRTISTSKGSVWNSFLPIVHFRAILQASFQVLRKMCMLCMQVLYDNWGMDTRHPVPPPALDLHTLINTFMGTLSTLYRYVPVMKWVCMYLSEMKYLLSQLPVFRL